jgi:3-oxoacyl-[acyl-carrier protein] reductase
MGRLSGKTTIVTGAARGIGKAIALRYAEEGSNLALCDLNLADAEGTAAEAREKGVRALSIQADVTRRAEVQALVDAAVEQFGTVDVLVNNAGIFFNAAFDEMTDEQWDHMMAVNVKGVFVPSQLVIRHWLERQRTGAIVNLASISAVIAFNNSAAYCSAKAAVASMTRCVAYEYGPRGIRANSMAPGIINTSMLPNMDDANRWANQKIPLRRMGSPADVADLAVFLGSDESRYITGDMIYVDGGWMLD